MTPGILRVLDLRIVFPRSRVLLRLVSDFLPRFSLQMTCSLLAMSAPQVLDMAAGAAPTRSLDRKPLPAFNALQDGQEH